MSRSGGISQLFKGIMIGIVLILAIVGTMSLLDKNDTGSVAQLNTPEQPPKINTPSISINPSKSQNQNLSGSNSTTDISTNNDQTQENSVDSESVNENPSENTAIPILENEKKAEDLAKQAEPIQYGMLSLSAINPNNQEKLKANYVVFNMDDVKVAESNNTASSSYRLPSGQYKVVITLTQADEKTNRSLPIVRKSRILTVRADSPSKQVFELEPPPTIGILQVSAISAKADRKAMRANFTVQKENGETVASRNNVTSSLFKLKAGSYKVTVKSGNNSDYRTVVVEAGESTEEIFKLQEAFNQGRVLVRIFDTRSSNPVTADITISSANGGIIQKLKSVSQTELSLAAGNYKIQVAGPNSQSNKTITVKAGQALSEIFRFDARQETSSNQGTQITDNVTIKGVGNRQSEAARKNNPSTTLSAGLKVFARDASNQQPLKSNIYIQTPSGKHLDKKIYVDSAQFKLAPGVYKVTVRSKNRENRVKTVRISDNQQVTQTFVLNKVGSNTASATIAPPKPAKDRTAIPNGFLNVSMLAANNQAVAKGGLNTHFIVATHTGKKIVELTGVPSGNFKLDTGVYVVTAIHKNKRRSQRVIIKENQNTQLTFNSDDFQTPKGVLKSRVVNESGHPLKADLTVTNTQGQIVARAGGVSVGVFDLPPTPHTVNVNYRGLRGSEVVKIAAGETTVQTFTIAPNRSAPANRNTSKTNNSKDIRKILRDKIKEEIQKQF